MKASILSILCFLLTIAPAAVHAQFTYVTNADGTLTITGYSGLGGAVVIPSIINTNFVTAIGDSVFAGSVLNYNSSLTSVTIPNIITSIGDEAFAFCANLANVKLPNKLTNIGMWAFRFDLDLTNVIIPGLQGPSIGYGAFETSGLESVTISNGVTSIGEEAFAACSELTSITFPGSVTNIGTSAFDGGDELMSVTMSNGVVVIGDTAFGKCFNLSNVTIPASVTNIGLAPFGGCDSMTSITVDPQNSFYSSANGILFNKSQSVLLEYPGGLGQGTIPPTVTAIGAYAFFDSIVGSVYFEGNAPGFDSTAFSGEIGSFYYLPNTSGWGNFSAIAGVPSVLWNPLIQVGDGSFGVKNNKFGFKITATNNFTVVVEASTNLANPVWTPLQTVTLTNGSCYFSDPQWRNYPARYYGLGFP